MKRVTETKVYSSATTQVQSKTKRLWASFKGFYSKYRGIFSLVNLVVGAIAIAFVLNAVIFHPYQVFGASMSPTLEQGDRLIVSKLAKSWASLWNREYVPARGEIIVFKNPVNPTEQLVKRVIALPGERIVVGDGEITVYNSDNPEGFDPDEAYKEQIDDKTAGNLDIEISEHHIFVSGDNRELGGSLDSRNGLGTVPLENVVGELILRITPFPEAKFF